MAKNDTVTIDEITIAREFDRTSGRTVKLVFRPGEKVDRRRAEKLGIVKTKKQAKQAAKTAVPDESPVEKPLSKMNKAELLALAAEVGVEADEEMTNKTIAAAIEAAGD